MPKLLLGKSSQQFGQVNREFRDLDVEELERGYIWSERDESYTCIFCGHVFEEGVVYPSGPRLLTAERAVKEHVARQHGSSFACLLSMDKQINGLTDVQKKILQCFYEGKGNDEICQLMDITPATVRTHRYNLQRMKREAKILLALMEQLEREDRPSLGSRIGEGAEENEDAEAKEKTEMKEMAEKRDTVFDSIPGHFSGNSLHPFFTSRRFD